MTETEPGGKKKANSTFSRLTFRNLSLKTNSKDKKAKSPVKDGVDVNQNDVSNRHSTAAVTSWESGMQPQQGRLTGIALQSFDAILPSDVSFKEGDHIIILTRTETQFDWWEGTVNGKTGIFPANYIKVL
ncbi:uncharacterized protein [Amphiura filiformis]|uniref:uncharacterized protein n=1 Tax=Amphiura filiformis TaxID=82378 RepID=UPI003B20F3E8